MTGGEDFSFFGPANLARGGVKDAAFLFLSVEGDEVLHSPRFGIKDERVLLKGAALHTALALRSLEELGRKTGREGGKKRDEL